MVYFCSELPTALALASGSKKRPALDNTDNSNDSDDDNSGHDPKNPKKKQRVEVQTYTEPLSEEEQARQAKHDLLFEQNLRANTAGGESSASRVPQKRGIIARRVEFGLEYADKAAYELHKAVKEIRESGGSDQETLDELADLAEEAGVVFPGIERAARRPITAAGSGSQPKDQESEIIRRVKIGVKWFEHTVLGIGYIMVGGCGQCSCARYKNSRTQCLGPTSCQYVRKF